MLERVPDGRTNMHTKPGVTLGQLTTLLEQVFMQSIVGTSKAPMSQGQQAIDGAELLAALNVPLLLSLLFLLLSPSFSFSGT